MLLNSACETLIFDDKFAQLWRLVGNTPMVKLCYRYEGKNDFIYVKCEQYNLTHSIKDRIALYMLQRAYQLGCIYPGYRIIEATSGNTGISFCAIGKALGHRVQIIMPDWLSKERVDIMKSFGAEVILMSKEKGGFSACIQLAEFMANQNSNIFLPRQFENPLNAAAHEQTTAPEIWKQLGQSKMQPDAFVAGVGTGGTIMGVSAFVRRNHYQTRVFPIEPAESPILSTGRKTGNHRIQGISDEFIPPIVQLSQLDQVIKVNDGDAILMAQKLANQLGLGVGISSGANVVGAIKVKALLGKDAHVVSVLPDCNKKYLSTDLVQVEREAEDYITPYVDFIGYQPLDKAGM
ncbi:MAG: PLP-dependent cysteine synthase family protein [Bacteroidetes bacterium]|nr:PLP-dependent cysteine synthase family protein [Bacteroidota bacterium]